MTVILGYGGYIEISREWPEPTAFPASSIKTASTNNYLFCKEPGFWTGQKVIVVCDRGVPIFSQFEAYAPCPDGHRFWGGIGVAGPTTTHRSNDSGAFWNMNDSVKFWEDATTTDLLKTISAYIHKDPLNRISFYPSETAAINKNVSLAYIFSPVDYGTVVMAGHSDDDNYRIAIEQLGKQCYEAAPVDETPASKITTIPETINTISGNPLQRGWYVLAGCREWSLQTEPAVLDTTAIGEDYGDSVKDVIRGSGSFNSLIPVGTPDVGKIDARGFIRLMLMTEIGAKARARFRLQEQADGICEGKQETLWLECDILLGQGEISAGIDEAILYSTQFVVVKDKDGRGVKPVIGDTEPESLPGVQHVFVDGVYVPRVFV